MCGICGIINLKEGPIPGLEILKRMMGRLRHRGPDSSGYYRDKHVALGHTRLAIIDLENGAQPLSNEDGSIWITFNGEIFNYVELASELRLKGHSFKTKSDTEVIVHAYEEWGTGCFERFNGQWGLAIWDRNKKQMVLSRDRLGIRPLYYTRLNNAFLFASEIKSLFANKDVKREFDPTGLSEVFTFWSPIAPRTIFKDVYELEPGHHAVVSNNTFLLEPYWSIRFPSRDHDDPSTEEENAVLLRQHLIKASRLRFTRSDVPVGAYLSGGLDSSITSAIVTKYTESPLKTFSIRFADPEFDEGAFQKEMVRRLGAEHHDVHVSYQDIGKAFPQVVWHTERPILRTAPVPLYLLSKLVRESGFKVVVTGEGADEVLAGYDLFREAKVRQFLSRNPTSNKRAQIILRLYPWLARSPGQAPAFARAFFSKSLDPRDPGLSHRPRWDTTAAIKLMLDPNLQQEMKRTNVEDELLTSFPPPSQKWDNLCKAQWLEMVSLLSGYILSAQGDRMLMANSVEGRFPFLDCELVDFANQLPPRHKLIALDEKHLLKIAFRDLIPDGILKRPKKPYRAPDAASFFNGKNLDWVDDLTDQTNLKRTGIFASKPTLGLIHKCNKVKGIGMSNTDNMRITAILSTLLVHHYYIEQDGKGFSDENSPEPITEIDKTADI
ncbi:MAG: asparagine synthase (glutamine-hydrolyzing) [Deltaproteobacteria bacterium]|nr:asparagine synthase (glutamine-hydrolyzing) [Deltaproteobacteria bacterium]